MNRRFPVSASNTYYWLQIIAKQGPFHRQYRHRQHLDRQMIDPLSDVSTDRKGWAESRTPDTPRAYKRSPRSILGRQSIYHRYPTMDRRIHANDKNRQIRKQLRNGIPMNDDFANSFSSAQIDSKLPAFHSQNYINVVPFRLHWFRSGDIQRPKVTTLLDRFNSEGMEVHITDLSKGKKGSSQDFVGELIMLECVDVYEQEMLIRLDFVRQGSRAPLIVLTDNHTLDWSLLALREGADAIFTLNTPDDVIVARSNALLRRWPSS